MADERTATAERSRFGKLPTNLLWGGAIVTVMLLLAALGPVISPYPYDEFHIAARLQPPSGDFWLGTDEFGRDVLSRVLTGARLSIFVGIGATALSLLLGVPLGIAAGYYRGHTDEAIMRTMDVIMSIPPILLGLLCLALTEPSVWKAMVAVGLVFVPATVRVTRSVTLGLVNEDFIAAARARGEHAAYIMLCELLPNAWPPIIVEASLRITFCIMLAAALSFLGVGAQPPSSDWGLMISEARAFLDSAPWIALSPGLAMCLTVIGINLLGDGLREVLDPRVTGRQER